MEPLGLDCGVPLRVPLKGYMCAFRVPLRVPLRGYIVV